MNTGRDPSVVPATDDDRSVVARLIQLYLYDMAAQSPFSIEADGLYAYDFLDRFWQTPYLLYREDELAGFALVIEGCPITDRADCHFMAEFFVLRPYRRGGLGTLAAQTILHRHPGDWHVATLEDNAPARAFWATALAPWTPTVTPATHDGDTWRVHALKVSATLPPSSG
ncbi:GNAT family N-acetyltransferase [Pelagovum pacificum]|uniref:GNAT family N-acetyltransferase n=1 Tax=Pelagovum pacificum TaxID=2588711 RepID=A0A5C5GDD7_9RHOB|nr:GNAT family N-acetyltransferase [Pelagovum pacificum]QQA41193.1 GNAT family N-acetyltransferase [Pelagovum pacificum]TNY31999.1 GNAT family N-acetyltransferase [Pelagovum pacificum]